MPQKVASQMPLESAVCVCSNSVECQTGLLLGKAATHFDRYCTQIDLMQKTANLRGRDSVMVQVGIVCAKVSLW